MATAAGAVTGGFLLEGKGWLQAKPLNAIGCAILWCIAITAFALSTNYYLAIGLLFIAGILNLAYLTPRPRPSCRFLRPPICGPIGRSFTMSALGLRAFSGVNRRRYWRIDRCSPVAGPQRDRSFCRHNRTFAFALPAPEHGELSGKINSRDRPSDTEAT
jgi:hypothetical protein